MFISTLGCAGLGQAPRRQQAGGEARAPDRHAQRGPERGERADMVLMGVGDDDAEQVGPVLDDVAEVGQDDVDARRLRPGEGEPAVDQDPFALLLRPEAVERGVHADLAEAAERDEDELVAGTGHWLS
jgi:hypothetical protein